MSKWEKLIQRILTMSKDMRFDELRKVLESYGYEMSEAVAHITHLESRALCPSQFRSMNRSKRFMYKW